MPSKQPQKQPATDLGPLGDLATTSSPSATCAPLGSEDLLSPFNLFNLQGSGGNDFANLLFGAQCESGGSTLGAAALAGTGSAAEDRPYSSVYQSNTQGDAFQVPAGQLTFDAEGLEDSKSRYFSRNAHWPGGASGVTIGRGYDMGGKSAEKIEADMLAAGLSAEDAKAYAGATGLTGDSAKTWLADHNLPQITPDQQKALFNISYQELSADVDRISNNYAKTKFAEAQKNGDTNAKLEDFRVNWDKIPPAMRDLAVDLRFRGDYTAETRKIIQPLLISGDLEGLAAAMKDETLWANVPKDRFDRRAAYLDEAVIKQKEQEQLKVDDPTTSTDNTTQAPVQTPTQTDPPANEPRGGLAGAWDWVKEQAGKLWNAGKGLLGF